MTVTHPDMRRFFMTIPEELLEASRIDGAGPFRFFWDTLLPLSVTTIAALFVIQFIYGWNQYLWPLLVTTEENMYPVVIGIKQMISGGDAQTEWNIVMATAMLAMVPPAIVVTVIYALPPAVRLTNHGLRNVPVPPRAPACAAGSHRAAAATARPSSHATASCGEDGRR